MKKDLLAPGHHYTLCELTNLSLILLLFEFGKYFLKYYDSYFLSCHIYDIRKQSEIHLLLFTDNGHVLLTICDYLFCIWYIVVFWMGPLLYLDNLLIYILF